MGKHVTPFAGVWIEMQEEQAAHSCHNVSRREFDEGVTYLQLMRQNAEHLKKGLE